MPGGQAAWRRPLKFHNLKRFKVRADMSKYNLYNLSRIKAQRTHGRTYFQQKWTAKSDTRAYHGEYVKERTWKRMFERRARAVVPLDPKQLAENDGSERAAGRGSGRQDDDEDVALRQPATPYMQMVYHPLERRLDCAIFRALFASSARQARQFCVHGHVKVNGRIMKHPSYLLNPGDMFQVDMDKVLYAMGQPKSKHGVKVEMARAGLSPRLKGEMKTREEARSVRGSSGEETSNTPSAAATEEPLEEEEAEEEELEEEEPDADDITKANRKTLLALRDRIVAVLTKPPTPLKAKQKQALRDLRTELRSAISKARTATPSTLDEFEAQTELLLTSITPATSRPSEAAPEAEDTPPTPDPSQSEAERRALGDDPRNPLIRDAPYLTPWRPRAYMSAFAFIPRYLEVNQRVCAAVYLRHPVCSPGSAEVPSPFAYETSQLAFNWYLRRGR